jgi:hypothetical protein
VQLSVAQEIPAMSYCSHPEVGLQREAFLADLSAYRAHPAYAELRRLRRLVFALLQARSAVALCDLPVPPEAC